jgi:hypothetical protein
MTMTEERVPAFYLVPSGALGRFTGRLLAEVSAGAVIQVRDFQTGIVRGYLTSEPPDGMELDPGLIPDVGAREFGRRSGKWLARVAAGKPVKISDHRMNIVRAYLTAVLPAGLVSVAGLIPQPLLPDGSPPPAPGEKHCPSCHQNKPANALGFHHDSRSPDGLSSKCRPCKNAVNAASWSRRHPQGAKTTR